VAINHELELFVASNREWLSADAEQLLRSVSPLDANRVVSHGSLSGCCDSMAVIRTRLSGILERDLSSVPAAFQEAAATAVGRAPRPASADEFDKFMRDNRPFMTEEAQEALRALNPVDRKRVIVAGTMSGCRNPVAVIHCRVRQAKEKEQEEPAAVETSSRLTKPASNEELEMFIAANRRWLPGEAEDVLRSFSPVNQKRVITAGSMAGICNPISVLHTRVKKSQELEEEFSRVTTSRPAQEPEIEVDIPTFTPIAAAGYMFTAPKEVCKNESRFAHAAGPIYQYLDQDCTVGALSTPNAKGVGGTVEVLAKKYGCARGERLRVIGEKSVLWQFEGGKTAPKCHEGTGWRWVLAEEDLSTAANGGSADDGSSTRDEHPLELSTSGRAASRSQSCSRTVVGNNGTHIMGSVVCKTADDFFGIGKTQAGCGDLAGAVESFRSALRVEPNDADIHFALGLLLKRLGELPSARQAFLASLRLDPSNADLHFSLGEVVAIQGDLLDAVGSFRAVVQIDWQRPDALCYGHGAKTTGATRGCCGVLPGCSADRPTECRNTLRPWQGTGTTGRSGWC